LRKLGDEKNGVAIQDRKKLFKTYTKCFVSSEAVQFLVAKLNYTRDTSIKALKLVQEAGYIEHVKDRIREFKDDASLFRFKEKSAPGDDGDDTNFFEFIGFDINKEPVKMSHFAGRVCLVVNVASK